MRMLSKNDEGESPRVKDSVMLRYKNEIILVAIILLVAILAILLLNTTRTEGNYAVVIYGGEQIAKYPLASDVSWLFDSDGMENLLVIKDGAAYISEANCPDGRCSRHTPIKLKGETIICLPHRLVIEIIE